MTTGKKKKAALIFTGAVSLGSFEAGVAYELVRHVQTKEAPELEIDVIVGTSAGALTGALAAISLVYGVDPKLLEESWLSVKLEDLLKLNPGDKSILSSSKVEKLISRFISPPPVTEDCRTQCKEINLAVVVTNLDGVKYRIHRVQSGAFSISAVGYEDALKFTINRHFTEWDKLRMAVQASSAYPGAFEAKLIPRNRRELERFVRYNFNGEKEKHFHYSDGGIVNNQPLNTAIELVNQLPENASEEPYERLFLVVDPTPPKDRKRQEKYGVFEVVSKAVWTIPRNQTLYKDLLMVEKANMRIRWKNSFILALADVCNQYRDTGKTIQALDDLVKDISLFKGQKVLGIPSEVYMNKELDRIKKVYSSEIAGVQNKELFTKYCFLTEHLSDLRNKHEIAVEMITPSNPENELAGVIFGNFGGFLSQGFMKHDFEVGKTYARRWLKKELDLYREVRYPGQQMPFVYQRKILQKVFDNTVPLLFEDIGPRLLGGKKQLAVNVVGVVNIFKMMILSTIKYVLKKSVSYIRKD